MAEKAVETLTRDEKIAQAKELYSRGSRNYLVKLYEEAADDLSQVCSLYSELYGELSNELGMPYLLYAKSLIALALEENKVIDVQEEDEDDDDESGENADAGENDEADGDKETETKEEEKENKSEDESKTTNVPVETENNTEKSNVNDKVEDTVNVQEEQTKAEDLSSKTNGTTKDNEIEVMPSTSNGIIKEEDTAQDNDDEADEAATNLQVAWETLELAAKIFKNQGESALPNLAEVYIELANIEFENNIMQSARDDFNKALEIYKNLSSNYRRPMAEIYYKIGLSHLMEQSLKESAGYLKEACKILDEEIEEMKNKENPVDKDKLNLQDMEETKQEIWVKITEIEESMQQCMSEVRAAIQNHMNPNPKCGESSSSSSAVATAAVSSSTADASSSSSSLSSTSVEKPKPTDISHLIKRKKPDTPTVDNSDMSPAKRPAT